MSGLATIVLAAGEGRRYTPRSCEPKQLALIDGIPMLSRVLATLDGIGDPQIVVLGARAEVVRQVVPADRWLAVVAEDWAKGPGRSLRAGLRAAPAVDAALIVLGDLPWLEREAAERVTQAASHPAEEAVRAFDGDTPGHPLLVRGRMLQAARNAPDAGLAAVLRHAPVGRVQCAELGVALDLDRRSDAQTATQLGTRYPRG